MPQQAMTRQQLPPCTTGCVINSRVGGDHAYCGCHCHVDTLPAIPPSRERQSIYDVAGMGARIEIRFSELDSAWRLYNTLVQMRVDRARWLVTEREKAATEIERMYGPHDRRFKTAIEIADKVRNRQPKEIDK
jgi:hypothetical protein